MKSSRSASTMVVIGCLFTKAVVLQSQESEISTPRVMPAAQPRAVHVDLRQLERVPEGTQGVVRIVPRRRPDFEVPAGALRQAPDPVVQRSQPTSRTAVIPGVSFAGISATGAAPPDTISDVGTSHIVQMVNTSFAVFDKSGSVLAGPSLLNTLWTALGAPCGTTNVGDPVVVHDGLADRWVLAQFANPTQLCIAVSQGANILTSGFFVYDFTVGDFPDYFKIGVWPNAYYIGANSQPRAFALDRSAMLAGSAATVLQFNVTAAGPHSMLMPADHDGADPPPPGASGYFLRHVDGALAGGVDRLELFEMEPDFVTPGNSTLSGPISLPTAAFASLCGLSFDCIRQPDTAQRVDSITEWPMWRLAYRNFGTHESMVINHAVNVGSDQAGVRWYELRSTGGGAWAIHQQSTFAPDGDSRWMASASMDREGNIAIGYNVSSTTQYPSLRYAGRLAGDVLDTLSLPETSGIEGGGSQTGTNRWGDYSSLNVDPADDCTFWFTGEYYASTSAASWSTRILSFSLPGCGNKPIFQDGFELGNTSAWN